MLLFNLSCSLSNKSLPLSAFRQFVQKNCTRHANIKYLVILTECIILTKPRVDLNSFISAICIYSALSVKEKGLHSTIFTSLRLPLLSVSFEFDEHCRGGTKPKYSKLNRARAFSCRVRAEIELFSDKGDFL